MKSEDDLIRALAEEVSQNAYHDFMDSVEHATKLSESPIERVLTMAWQANPIEGISFFSSTILWDAETLLAHDWPGSVEWVGSIQPQVTVGSYRADLYLQAFSIDNWGHKAKITCQWLRLAIECDGHDFHEKTKDQARRDKRRDRWFQTHGITVLRFAGSEIWESPASCVDQVHDAFFAAWNRLKHSMLIRFAHTTSRD